MQNIVARPQMISIGLLIYLIIFISKNKITHMRACAFVLEYCFLNLSCFEVEENYLPCAILDFGCEIFATKYHKIVMKRQQSVICNLCYHDAMEF